MNGRSFYFLVWYIAGTCVMAAAALLFLLPLPAAWLPVFSGSGFLYNMQSLVSSPKIMRAAQFTVLQALCSMLIAAAVGIPAAFFTARRSFPGRRLLLSLSAIPLCTPPLLIALAFVLFYGKNGVLNSVINFCTGGSAPQSSMLYSFFGVVITQGLYNFPMFMRITGNSWSRMDSERICAARLLGASEPRIFCTVTLPYLLPSIGAAALPVFLSCFFSFIIVLLFGGIGITTLEVELYQAARSTLDYTAAGGVALIETLIAVCITAAYAVVEHRCSKKITAQETQCMRLPLSGKERIVFLVYACLLAVFFFGPLFALVVRSFCNSTGFNGLTSYQSLCMSPLFRRAAVNTLLTGLQSAGIATAAGLFFAVHSIKKSQTSGETGSRLWINVLAMTPLAVSGIVSGFGWMQITGGGIAALICAQAAASCPYVMRTIRQQLQKIPPQLYQAAGTLGAGRPVITGTVIIPLCKKSILSGFCFAFAVSAGDASLPLILGIPGYESIALMLFRYAGARRLSTACACGVILALITGILFFIQDYTHENR